MNEELATAAIVVTLHSETTMDDLVQAGQWLRTTFPDANIRVTNGRTHVDMVWNSIEDEARAWGDMPQPRPSDQSWLGMERA